MMSLFDRLLKYYNFSKKDYEKFTKLGVEEELPVIKNEKDFNLLKRIKKAVDNKEKIIISGDYDCDGITSTSILYMTLKKLGGDVGYFIPSRYIEGYGLNKERIKQFNDKGYKLLITVDNGITCIDEVEYAKDLGFDVIIIDHHEPKEVLPDADYIFHQTLSKVTDYNISAAFLALIVSQGLLSYFDSYYIVLAGIAVLSDVMPLVEANLSLLRLALKYLNKYKYEQIIKICDYNIIDEMYLSFSIIPRINAIGRVETGLRVNDAVKLLVSSDSKMIQYYANELESCNQRRKELTSKYDKNLIKHYQNFCIYDSNLPVGLGGLLANKIMTLENKPTIVLTKTDGIYTCSIRAFENYDVMEVLKNVSNLISCGGHTYAAGFSFEEKYLDFVLNQIDEHLMPSGVIKKHLAIDLSLEEINKKSYDVIQSFAPFGQNHDEPLFHLRVDNDKFSSFDNNKNHIFIQLNEAKVVFFNGLEKLDKSGATDLYGKFSLNYFRNNCTLQFIISEKEQEKEYSLIF